MKLVNRPRFLLLPDGGSGAASSTSAAPDGSTKINIIHASACFSAAALLLLRAYISSLSGNQTLALLLLWPAVALLLAPFAPLSATGGDIRVRIGDPLPYPEPSLDTADMSEPKRGFPGRRSRSQKKPEICRRRRV